MCCSYVGTEENANCINAQKELLLWNLKLCISMHNMQELMHAHTAKESSGKYYLMTTMIKAKFASTSNCPAPKCISSELSCAKKHNPQVMQQQMIKD